MNLFESVAAASKSTPLAERLRPQTWDEVFGQADLAGDQALLRQMVERGELSSSLFWGPPGTGKTTLSHLIAHRLKWHFVAISAVMSGVKELREALQVAQDKLSFHGQRTLLFIDEIHRFNKAQQDALLPFVEQGSVILIGATTENPSFEVNPALLSRLRVFTLQPLDEAALVAILQRALRTDAKLQQGPSIDPTIITAIAQQAAGDARKALNLLEYLSGAGVDLSSLQQPQVQKLLAQALLYHDKSGQHHYDTISALHKSMRNSDPDATLYWLARMLEAGDDPLYVARRLVRFASEDIGLADSRALTLALAAKETAHFVGMPECALALAQAAVFMALAPKNNSIYTAYGRVKAALAQGHIYPVPAHLRNAVTKFDKAQGFGSGYEYAHDHPQQVTTMSCLPEKLAKSPQATYYQPKKIGSEASLVDAWQQRLKHVKGEKPDEN